MTRTRSMAPAQNDTFAMWTSWPKSYEGHIKPEVRHWQRVWEEGLKASGGFGAFRVGCEPAVPSSSCTLATIQ